MSADDSVQHSIELALRIASDLAEYRQVGVPPQDGSPEDGQLAPYGELLAEYDRRVLDEDLRAATRSRFVALHYADAVESAVKALNECVRKRSGRGEDGDELMTIAFHPNSGKLRVNKLRSKSDDSAQRGHMLLCQGVVAAWRNPRAHSLMVDEPARALMMMETIDELITVTKAATRRRKRKAAS